MIQELLLLVLVVALTIDAQAFDGYVVAANWKVLHPNVSTTKFQLDIYRQQVNGSTTRNLKTLISSSVRL